MRDFTDNTTLAALALVATATLASWPATAQPVQPAPPSQVDQMPRQRAATDRFQPTSVEGTVTQYLMNPHGGGGWIAAPGRHANQFSTAYGR